MRSGVKQHWNKVLAQYILSRIKGRFKIDSEASYKSEKWNLLSAETNADVVTAYLDEEVTLVRVLGPLHVGSIPGIQGSPFGVIPNTHTLGSSGSYLIQREAMSIMVLLQFYFCCPTLIQMIQAELQLVFLGRGTLLAKIDVKSAYRIVPVHPDD